MMKQGGHEAAERFVEPVRRLVYRLELDGAPAELWLASGAGDAVEQSWLLFQRKFLSADNDLLDRWPLTDAELAAERLDYERSVLSITLLGRLSGDGGKS
jgi:hypothetical protein